MGREPGGGGMRHRATRLLPAVTLAALLSCCTLAGSDREAGSAQVRLRVPASVPAAACAMCWRLGRADPRRYVSQVADAIVGALRAGAIEVRLGSEDDGAGNEAGGGTLWIAAPEFGGRHRRGQDARLTLVSENGETTLRNVRAAGVDLCSCTAVTACP